MGHTFLLWTTEMTGVVAIQYTQEQVRILLGVTAETLRHWRKAIPYLSAKAGKAARFSFGDLLGLAITNELVNSLGVHISSVSRGVDALFRLLAETGSVSLDTAVVYVTATNATLLKGEEGGAYGVPAEPSLAIAIGPQLARLQQQMLPLGPVSNQTALPFPLEAVRSKRS